MRQPSRLFRTTAAIALGFNLGLFPVALFAEGLGAGLVAAPQQLATAPVATAERDARFNLGALEAALHAEGLAFHKTVLPNGDVLYAMQIAGVKFALIAYGTVAGAANSMQLTAIFSGDEDEPRAKKVDAVNKWNEEKRFLKAYVDGDNDVTVEMDLVPVGPVEPKELVRTISETWAMGLMYFAVSSH